MTQIQVSSRTLPFRNLGEKISSIELDTPAISEQQMNDLEASVNEKIRSSVAMYPTLYESVTDPKLKEV